MAVSEMGKQPLWLDVSKHQGQLDYEKIAAIEGYNKVYGVISRAGWGQDGGYIDQYFNRNWEKTEQYGLYRASYWAYWGYFPLQHQLDLWYQANPTIDFIPRMWDFEVEDNNPQWLSDKTWEASEIVKARDGHRFIIYSSEAILERTLCKYWTPEQLNEHYYMLAQYDFSTPENPQESNGIRVPLYIEPDRILWKQTSSDYQIYSGSGRVDRDRWIWTDAETMHDDLQEFWGDDEPTPPTPQPDCCEEVKTSLENQAGKLSTLRTDVDSIEVRSNDNHVRLGTTRTELAELEDKVTNLQDNKLAQLERGIGNNATSLSDLKVSIDDMTSRMEDVEDNIESYMSELEGRITDVEAKVNAINTKITIIGWLRKLFGKSDE